MAEHLTEEHLKKLTSRIMYSHFEDEQRKCEHIPFYSSIKDEIESRYPNLLNISQKILKALCFIYNEKRDRQNKLNEEYCSSLFYWLGYNILQNLSDKSLFQNIINMIYNELYISGMYSTCKYLYDNIDEKTFNTYKLLFDYSKDNGNINLSTAHGYTTCDEHYKEVMYNYINAYKDAHLNCTGTQRKNFFCEYFNKLFSNENYEKLTTFTCREYRSNNDFSGVPKPRDIESTASVLVPPDEVANLYGTSRPTYNRDIDRNGHNQRYLRRYPDQNVVDQHTLYGNPVPPVVDSTEGGSSKTIAGSIVPVLGVSSFSLLLYKVTPVGGYINRLLGRNRNMYNQIEYMDAFNPYSEGMDSMGRRINISYHRL